uniref:Uncharacterized protein n=1 Tax=Opuntia streptacantha TaxID=393608 RepID=A0A7C9CLT6_OPUST
MASKMGISGGDPGGDGGPDFFFNFLVLGSTTGAPSGKTAEMERRLRRRLNSSTTVCGIKSRSIPWITPSGRTTSFGRITLARSTVISPESFLCCKLSLWLESVVWWAPTS